jgi:hypothetical protein
MQHRMMITSLVVAAALAAAWSPAAAQRSDSTQALSPARQAASSAAARPAPEVTRYTLVEVGGTRLPALVEKVGGCEENVTAGTLALSGDGRWSLETVTREVCGDRTDEDRDNDDGTYRADGGTLRFLDDDGRDTDGDSDTDLELDELETGTIAKDGTLKVQLADGKTTLVFRR